MFILRWFKKLFSISVVSLIVIIFWHNVGCHQTWIPKHDPHNFFPRFVGSHGCHYFVSTWHMSKGLQFMNWDISWIHLGYYLWWDDLLDALVTCKKLNLANFLTPTYTRTARCRWVASRKSRPLMLSAHFSFISEYWSAALRSGALSAGAMVGAALRKRPER